MKLGHLYTILAMVLSSSIGFSAHHAFNRAPLVDTTEIERWVKTSASAPKTVEDFLAKLPLVYRSHFTLMYDSRSMHRATPQNPRIIFFGPDSRLMTAVSTDPTDPRREIIEFIEFDPKTSRFSFYEADFGGPRPQFIRQPTSCKNCHGTDGRPNWEPYDAWPGAYGSVHDTLKYKTHENALFTEFLKTYGKEPRFLSLPKTFFMKHETFGGDPTYYTVSRGGGLNSAFSITVNFLNRERLARILVESPEHAKYRNAITAALVGCNGRIESFLPKKLRSNHPQDFETVLAQTTEIITRDHDRRVLRTAELQKITDLEDFTYQVDRFGLREKEILRTARLRYLLENRIKNRVNMDRWGLSLLRDSYNFNDGNSGLENLVGHYVPMAFDSSDPLRKLISYKTMAFDVTSYSNEPGHSGHPDAFKLELFEAPEPTSALCTELERLGAGN